MAKKQEKLEETKTMKNKPKSTASKTKKAVANNQESIVKRIKNFFGGVKTEAKRVKWPSKKEMMKYSIATIVFIIGCSLFFYAIDIIMAFLHTLGK